MPKISIVILNYNGTGVILPCLRSILALAWTEVEILVVDNASTDESDNQIAEEFGDRVRIIRRAINSPTAGRNEGFQEARGEYVLSLDNDILLVDPMVLHKAVAILDRFPKVGALSFKIGGLDTPNEPLIEHWWHPVDLQVGKDRFFFTDWFAEGAVFFRRSALSATQGYDEDLFHGYESVDLALRILEHSFEILYCPNLRCAELRIRGLHHVFRRRMNYLFLRNKLWTAWKDYPLGRGLYFALTRSGTAAIRALRYGWLDLWFQAMVEGIAAPNAIRKKRRPVTSQTWKRIRRIRKGQFCPEATCISSAHLTVLPTTVPAPAGKH